MKISPQYPHFYKAREDAVRGLSEELILENADGKLKTPTPEECQKELERCGKALIVCIKDEKLLLQSFMGENEALNSVIITDNISRQYLIKEYGIDVKELKCNSITEYDGPLYLCTDFEIINPDINYPIKYHMVPLTELDQCDLGFYETYNLICSSGTSPYMWWRVMKQLYGGIPTADGVIRHQTQ